MRASRRNITIYTIVSLSFIAHYAVWGVAEFYLINGFWYLLGWSPVYSVDIAYWFYAWQVALWPFAVLVLTLIWYFLSGFVKISKPWTITKMELQDLITQHFKIKSGVLTMLVKTLLSIGIGLGIGNIIQDRLCGALHVFTNPSFWPMYSTFNFDPVGAVLKWIGPILIYTIIALWYVYRK